MATAEAAAVEKCNGQELDGRRRSRWPSPPAAASAVAVTGRRPAHHASDSVQHPGDFLLAPADRELCGRDGRGVARRVSDRRRGRGPGHEAPHRDERGRSLGDRPASVDLLPPRSLKLRVTVFDNQIEAALKTLKKQMLKAGLFQEMKRRVAYETSSVKRRRKQTAARKKRRKAMRRMERDSE